MREVMTSLVVPLKHYNSQSKISLEISKQCSLNLAPELNIAKERIWRPSWHCHDNSHAAGPVLIETEIPRFYLKQELSTPNNLMGKVWTIWEPDVFGSRPSVPLKGLQMGLFVFFTERDRSQECYHGNNIEDAILFLVCYTFLVQVWKKTAPIFLEIFLIHGGRGSLVLKSNVWFETKLHSNQFNNPFWNSKILWP